MRTSKAGVRTLDAGFRIRGRTLCNLAVAPRSSLLASQRGISLVELIMFIVIVSVALTGLLLVMNVTGKGSVDPLLHKQALATAESLLEEIELQSFTKPDGGFGGPYTPANRSQFDCITDYNGFATNGVYQLDGVTPVPGLENYNISVAVANAALDSIPAASAAQITVTVTEPGGQTVNAIGYRANY